LPSTQPLAQTTQTNLTLKKAWTQETSFWRKQVCQKRRSSWVGFFDFRQLRTSLPENNFIAWTENINKLIADGTSTAKEFELTIGRLGHLALVVPGVHHFLSRLRELQQLATHRHSI
jgi:hypothetical protein